MALKNRLKQALLAIGALTVLGMGILVGGALYLMWDARKQRDVTSDFSTDIESSDESESADPADEKAASAETDAETSTTSDVSA